MPNWIQTQYESNAASIGFLKVEVDTGLMFANLAMNSDNHEKAARNCAHARLAYDTVLRFVGRVSLIPAESRSLAAKMNRLKLNLKMLGESL